MPPSRKASKSLIPFLPSVPNRVDGKPPPPRPRGRFELSDRAKPYALVLGTILMTATATMLAWWFTLSRPARVGSAGVPVLVTVESNIPVVAKVRHRASENRSVRESVQLLGESPELREVSGAHVGDTIALENEVQGAYFEHVIEYGQPNEHIILRKEFRTGHVQFRMSRAMSYGLGVFRNATQLAPYVADVQIELVEGGHQLEIRGYRLKKPVKVAVEVKAGRVTQVDAPRLELVE